MSERNDRRLGVDRPLVLAITTVIIVVVAAGGGYLWHRHGSGLPPAPVPQERPQAAAPVRPDEPVPVSLFVPANGMLEPVMAGVRNQSDVQLEAREAIAAVLSADRGGQAPVLKELRLRAFFLDPAGTAFVDLSPGGQKEVRASVWEELLAVYAVVNTLTQNFPEIRQVRFLLDGREAQTLAGHVDLSRSYVKRTDLVRPR